MLKDITLGQYFPIDSMLHKLDARTKILLLIFNIVLLVFFKYSGFIADNVSGLLGIKREFIEPALPIGISFYTFQIMSYIICVYRKKQQYSKAILILHFTSQCSRSLSQARLLNILKLTPL